MNIYFYCPTVLLVRYTLLMKLTVAYQSGISVRSLVDFVEKGGNVLLSGSSQIPEILRDFAFEFSADFDDSNTSLNDDFQSVKLSSGINALWSSSFGSKATPVLTPGGNPVGQGVSMNPILFNGVTHRLTGRNPLVIPVLTGSSTSYSLQLGRKGALVNPNSPFIGSNNVLVSAFQARNNARVVFSGSSDLFSDA